jgi:hypothetical protein
LTLDADKLYFHGRGTDRTPYIAFACTHVYHLSCIDPDAADVTNTQRGDDLDHAPSFQRSVSVKVTHAALLRDKLKGGCIVCAERKRAEIVV